MRDSVVVVLSNAGRADERALHALREQFNPPYPAPALSGGGGRIVFDMGSVMVIQGEDLDHDELLSFIEGLEWAHDNPVQVLIRDQDASTFSMHAFGDLR